ncbi:MAG: emp24/gp25L/p24 family protein [Chloroflexi bacterium]|nr:emp24/gp25L/p24 family protein [Chloroflexota bacterium]
MKTVSGIWKILLILLVTFIIGVTACVQPQPTPPVTAPKVYHRTFVVSSSFWRNLPPEIIKVDANQGETIRVMFSVSGGWARDINFSMKDPSGVFIYEELKIPKQFSDDFLASTTGTYQLLFVNKSPWWARTITLNVLVFPEH